MQVGMHQAKTQLSQLVERALAGETVVLTRNGRPVAQIVPYTAPARRRLAQYAGRVWFADDWDSAETNARIRSDIESAIGRE